MKCHYCFSIQSNLSLYYHHHKFHHSLKPFVCSCSRSFPPQQWQSFTRHLRKCKDHDGTTKVSGSNSNNDHSSTICSETLTGGSNATSTLCSETLTGSSNATSSSSNSQFVTSNFSSNLSYGPSAIHSAIDSFVSKLYEKPKLPRSYVQSIIEDVSSLIQNGVLTSLKSAIKTNVKLDDAQWAALDSAFSSIEDPFFHLRSEYHRFQYFTSTGDYIAPIAYEIGELDVNENGRLVKRKVYGQSVPLDEVLKNFLETSNTLNEILSYMQYLETNSDVKQNFVQSKLWKTKRDKFQIDEIVLPLFFYDDCQCNNPLGSHAEKLGCVYVQIACLPPECMSTISNIFLALVFKTAYRCFSDQKVFAPLIDVLKSLEVNGIVVNILGVPKKVYFVTSLLLGDNLGLDSLGGFAETFTANYFCRFCKTHKSETMFQSVEDKSSLRTEENYNADVAIDNVSLTGIKSDSVLNALPSFHITKNFCVDIFHDFSEGICHYVMIQVLKHCIPLYFSLDLLNHRIEMFQYSSCDSNRIPVLSNEFHKKDKLKMSGSETLLFVRLFGIIIGDKVPCDDPFWRLYVKLYDLMDVCQSKSFSNNQGSSLKVLVDEFNSLYVEVTNEALKPKFHNLVHYETALEESGPMTLTSTLRFERKHRSLLIPAHATTSRRDICRSVAIQHQLHFRHRLKSNFSIMPQTEICPITEVFLTDFPNPEFVKHLPANIRLTATAPCFSANWLEFKGTKYKPGMTLLLNIDQSGGPIFGHLDTILVSDNVPIFVYCYLLCLGIDEHLHSYEVNFTDRWSCISPSDLYDPLPLGTYASVLGKIYVPLRYAL